MEQYKYGSDVTISLATVRYCDVISDNSHSIEFMHSAALIILKIGLISSVYPRQLFRETLRCHLYPSVTVFLFYFGGGAQECRIIWDDMQAFTAAIFCTWQYTCSSKNKTNKLGCRSNNRSPHTRCGNATSVPVVTSYSILSGVTRPIPSNQWTWVLVYYRWVIYCFHRHCAVLYTRCPKSMTASHSQFLPDCCHDCTICSCPQFDCKLTHQYISYPRRLNLSFLAPSIIQVMNV